MKNDGSQTVTFVTLELQQYYCLFTFFYLSKKKEAKEKKRKDSTKGNSLYSTNKSEVTKNSLKSSNVTVSYVLDWYTVKSIFLKLNVNDKLKQFSFHLF